jgi:hypothetical protein
VLSQDRVEDAYKSFVMARAEAASVEDTPAVKAEFELLHLQLIHEKQNAVAFVDLFLQPHLRKRCIVGFLTMFGAQGTATLVINSEWIRCSGRLVAESYSRLWSAPL